MFHRLLTRLCDPFRDAVERLPGGVLETIILGCCALVCLHRGFELLGLLPTHVTHNQPEVLAQDPSVRTGAAGLRVQDQEHSVGQLVELPPPISPQMQPMPDHPTNQQRQQSPGYLRYLWTQVVCPLCLGILIGYFFT